MRHRDEERMRRRNVPSREKPVTVKPLVLHPNAVLTLERARQALELGRYALKLEVKEGRLRVSRRGGRFYTTGAWMMEWIQAGEVKRPAPADDSGEAASGRHAPTLLERLVRGLPKLTLEERQQLRTELDQLDTDEDEDRAGTFRRM